MERYQHLLERHWLCYPSRLPPRRHVLNRHMQETLRSILQPESRKGQSKQGTQPHALGCWCSRLDTVDWGLGCSYHDTDDDGCWDDNVDAWSVFMEREDENVQTDFGEIWEAGGHHWGARDRGPEGYWSNAILFAQDYGIELVCRWFLVMGGLYYFQALGMRKHRDKDTDTERLSP